MQSLYPFIPTLPFYLKSQRVNSKIILQTYKVKLKSSNSNYGSA